MTKLTTLALTAAGGFIAGLLLAPKTGKESRKDVVEKTHEIKDKTIDSLQRMKKGANAVKDEVISGGESVKKIATDTTEDVRRTAIR